MFIETSERKIYIKHMKLCPNVLQFLNITEKSSLIYKSALQIYCCLYAEHTQLHTDQGHVLSEKVDND